MLAEGGMGAVFVARNVVLDVRVALKVVRPGLEPSSGARLLDEARASACLEHPGIVKVFDFGVTDDGDPFIVMELLDGRNLGDLLRQQRRLRPGAAAQILLPVLDALITAHDHGIVHRDLTPENIFLAREARRIQPKIVDFGLVLLQQRAASRITLNGTIVGSPRYMSPEQARGEEIDHRSDLWTICAVLYEAVTGRAPFDGDVPSDVLESIVRDPPVAITELGVDDPALWVILQKGLEKDVALRWPSAGMLGRALAEWLVARGVREDICGGSLGELWLSQPPPDTRREDLFCDVLPLVRVRGARRSSAPPPIPGPAPQVREDLAPVIEAHPIERTGIDDVPDTQHEDGETTRTAPLRSRSTAGTRRRLSSTALAAIAGSVVLLTAVLATGHAFLRPSVELRSTEAEEEVAPPAGERPGHDLPIPTAMTEETSVPEPSRAPEPVGASTPLLSPALAGDAVRRAPARRSPRSPQAFVPSSPPPSDPFELKEPY